MKRKCRNVWIISGESSGDMYGARLAQELRKQAEERGEDISISGMGGKSMAESGVNILVDSTELGVMGAVEVLKLIFTFIRIFYYLLEVARRERPDAVILIDYPGFNLRFAKALYKAKIPVIWYVSPQVWVWGKHRLPKLARYCKEMLVIFPFEVEVYEKVHLDTRFVGHPLLEIVAERRDPAIVRDADLVALLPGSRRTEIGKLLRSMLDSALLLHEREPRLRFHICAPRERMRLYCQNILDKFLAENKEKNVPQITLSAGETAIYMQKAIAGIAASGTVTVESAIAGMPLVVTYRMNWITILMASMLVKLYRGFFCMVNIICNRTVFQEFLQHKVTPANLAPALEAILPGGARREEVEEGMAEMVKLLSPDSDGKKDVGPFTRAAQAVYEELERE